MENMNSKNKVIFKNYPEFGRLELGDAYLISKICSNFNFYHNLETGKVSAFMGGFEDICTVLSEVFNTEMFDAAKGYNTTNSQRVPTEHIPAIMNIDFVITRNFIMKVDYKGTYLEVFNQLWNLISDLVPPELISDAEARFRTVSVNLLDSGTEASNSLILNKMMFFQSGGLCKIVYCPNPPEDYASRFVSLYTDLATAGYFPNSLDTFMKSDLTVKELILLLPPNRIEMVKIPDSPEPALTRVINAIKNYD